MKYECASEKVLQLFAPTCKGRVARFLFSHPEVSLFDHQCEQLLGYHVGELRATASLERTTFVPSPLVWTRDEREPKDP